MTTPISVGKWNVQVARRHEHLLFCPVIRDKCRGEKCEWWDTTTLRCAVIDGGEST